jgi:hypothetical protein
MKNKQNIFENCMFNPWYYLPILFQKFYNFYLFKTTINYNYKFKSKPYR